MEKNMQDTALARRLVAVRPSHRQVAWQQNEFTAFLHFGINTFTGREWGTGAEDPALFNPTGLDTDQWCAALQQAGVRGVLLTAKHHDGFCLWHTAQTRHSVQFSPYGRDIAAQLSQSCHRYGLKLGFYLSPWDRHEPCYGDGKPYDDFFCAQLEELLTGYGELYCIWFDGACGEGKDGKRQMYDWERYYGLIRRHQPAAAISVCGPDVRWCGNEAGDTRPAEWSVVPAALRDVEKIQAASQQADDDSFRGQCLSSAALDLGSRGRLAGVDELCWYPAEVDVSIRPGWFWNAGDNGSVKSLATLLRLYDKAVGGNALLLLNVPPDTRGLIHEADMARLAELGAALRGRFSHNVAAEATITASAETAGHPAAAALVDDGSYWLPPEECGPMCLTLEFPTPVTAERIVLAEQITESQRIEQFRVLAVGDAGENTLCEGETVGYKRICEFSPVTLDRLVIEIPQSRVTPTLRFVGVY